MEATETPPVLPYTFLDAARAHADWGANCGPHSLAAALGLSLDEVFILMPEFEALPRKRRYTNPTMLEAALNRAGRKFSFVSRLKTQQLCNGISRVQWVGPWLEEGQPVALAYRYTHWVAHKSGWVLCTACDPDRWMSVDEWTKCLKAQGFEWYITHHYYL